MQVSGMQQLLPWPALDSGNPARLAHDSTATKGHSEVLASCAKRASSSMAGQNAIGSKLHPSHGLTHVSTANISILNPDTRTSMRCTVDTVLPLQQSSDQISQHPAHICTVVQDRKPPNTTTREPQCVVLGHYPHIQAGPCGTRKDACAHSNRTTALAQQGWSG